MKEKNYMLRYDGKGMVNRLEVYSAGATPSRRAVPESRVLPPAEAASSPAARSRPRNMSAVRKNPPEAKKILSPLQETETDHVVSKETRVEGNEDTNGEGYEEEMPFEPAGNIPVYIPPRRPEN